MFSLDQVRGFLAVADELHFGRAAERLQMTQPPLSRQIQKLELAIGVVLLDRSSRGVTLTPAGEVFLLEARRLIALADSAPLAARRVAEGLSGRITIGFTAMAASSVLGDVLRRISNEVPDVEIVLQELVTNAQVEALVHGELDLALLRRSPQGADFASRLVHREALYAAIPVDHPLAADSGPLDPAAFDGLDMILYSRSDAGYFDTLVTSVLGANEPRSIQRVAQVHSMLSLVAAHRGLAIVPDSARVFQIAGVVFRPIRGWRDEVVELFATWRTASNNAALERVIGLIPPLE